jgi:hypothetical protein
VEAIHLSSKESSVKKLLILALALVASLGVVSTASASSRDRNHDRLPDKWERAHHLSLKVKQAKRDQDRDGLNNRGEFRAKLNPRDRDTDNDGIKDGEENAGTIKSFDGGVLTITLAEGGDLAATVTPDTEIECHGTATASSHDDGGSGSGSGSGSDDPAGDDSGSGGSGSDDPAGHDTGDDPAGEDTGDDHGDDPAGEDTGDDHGHDGPGDGATCGTDALKAGVKVREAELKVSSDGKRWEKLELATA